MKGQHLICYDGTCGLCHWMVQFLLKHDKKEIFVFTPLQGKTVQSLFHPLPHGDDTVVLIENYQTDHSQRFIFGKAALRICWLLRGIWVVPGLLSFLPSFLYDWLYKWVAKHRFQWFGREECLIPSTEDTKRFLD